jgi:hypothetical protein
MRLSTTLAAVAVFAGACASAMSFMGGRSETATQATPEARANSDGVIAVPLAPGTAAVVGRQAAGAMPAAQRVRDDVDGDGRSDLLLEHEDSSSVAYWRMLGADMQNSSPILSNPPGFKRIATADFNGNGRMDVLWVRASDRQVLMWLSDGIGFVEVSVGQHAQEWQVFGAGDVDGDGKSDVLLRSGGLIAWWLMDGASIVGQPPAVSAPPGLMLVAHGDFNGDRKLDLVWEERETRTLSMWLGTGTEFMMAAVREYALGWQVWGAGDVDGDGRSDLLLTHPSDRFFAYWIMDGATPVRYSPAFRLPGEASLARRYGPVAVGDYNGDGKLDIVLSRERDRSLVMWVGDGNGFFELPVASHAVGWRVVRTFGFEGAPVRPYVAGDADGDGKADFFVLGLTHRYNPDGPPYYPAVESGANRHSLRNGPTAIGHVNNPTLGGIVLATGDFDGDGRQDVVIEKDPDAHGMRRTVIRLSSRVPQYEVEVPTPAPGWRIIGAGDVDGDGRSDLLLGEGSPAPVDRGNAVRTQNPEMRGFAYWQMERGTVKRYSVGFLVDLVTPRLAAIGDFDGDGRLDLAWSNASGTSTQRLVMWRGDGNGFHARSVHGPTGQKIVPVSGWHVFGAGDIDGDGRSDLLLHETGSTESTTTSWRGMAYWLMVDNSIVEYSPGFVMSASDRIFGDYNGDGRLDFVFIQDSTHRSIPRSLTMWLGDGRGFVAFPSGGIRSPGLLGDAGEMIFNR